MSRARRTRSAVRCRIASSTPSGGDARKSRYTSVAAARATAATCSSRSVRRASSSGSVTPSLPMTHGSVAPCMSSVPTATRNAIAWISGRPGNGEPSGSVAEIAAAAASVTTPRMPVHEPRRPGGGRADEAPHPDPREDEQRPDGHDGREHGRGEGGGDHEQHTEPQDGHQQTHERRERERERRRVDQRRDEDREDDVRLQLEPRGARDEGRGAGQDGDHERRLQLSPTGVCGHHDRAEHDQDELDAVHARGP
jgi:hypothetical protein